MKNGLCDLNYMSESCYMYLLVLVLIQMQLQSVVVQLYLWCGFVTYL